MREKTFLNHTLKDFAKHIEYMNKQEEKGGKPTLLVKNYRDGVLFGDLQVVTFCRDGRIIATETKQADAYEQFFDAMYRDMDKRKKADVIEGSTEFFKKALKLTDGKNEVYLNKKLVGDLPDGAEFMIYNHKTPVAIVYNGEIIKCVCPFIGVRHFVEA